MKTSLGAQRPKYQHRFDQISRKLDEYESEFGELPGIVDPLARKVLLDQLIDSERRNSHFANLRSRLFISSVADPKSDDFDPLKGALFNWRAGDKDEAFWLIFIFIHFGKHPVSKWRFAREVYGRLGQDPIWSWPEISANTPEFRLWLGDNQAELLRRDQRRGFGNHRKYSSLRHDSARGTAAVFESYVEWVMSAGNHERLFHSHLQVDDSFDALYRSMDSIVDFGRIAKFDYLMTLSRLNFLPIKPSHSYLQKATGPLVGAKLLLTDNSNQVDVRQLESATAVFSNFIGVSHDVTEDAICNWQKSPVRYVAFVI